MRSILVTLALIANLAVQAQPKPVMQPATMQEDFVYLRHYLETTHPMLYIHHTREEMNAQMDSLAGTLNQPLPFLEFYKKIAYLLASVGCEHTSSNYWQGFDKFLPSVGLFPYQLYFMNDKVFALVNMTKDGDIKPGDELLSINNQSIDSIRKELYRYLPVDGKMTTPKNNMLSSMSFNIWYYLYIGQPEEFAITWRTKEGKLISKTVKAGTLKKLNQLAVKNVVNKPVFEVAKRLTEWRREPLRLELFPDKRAAVMTVHSFSVGMERFRNRIDSFFRVMSKNNIEKLIIVLTNNGGGEVELAADLLNYFIKEPASIVQYSYLLTDKDEDFKLSNIPDDVRRAKYDFIEPLKHGKSYVKLSNYSGELKMLQPRPDRFIGKVYLFVNGATSSAASTFAAVMKSLGLATIVGEETVGGYAGGGTTIGLDLTLPSSKINVHSGIVYQRFQTKGGDQDRGVIPDVPYEISFEELFSTENKWRDFILGLK